MILKFKNLDKFMNNQPKADQSKTGKTLIIAGIVLLALVAGGFWYISNESRKSTGQILNNNGQELARKNNEELIKVFKDDENISDSERIGTSNWKTYRNDHYGYQISYPTDWSVYERNYNKDRLTFKRIILNFLSKFMIINPNYPRPTLKTIEFYITKDCNLDELKEHNKMCPNYVKISTHDMTSSSCGVRVENGKLPITTLSAFNNIFTLKEGEDREALQYKKDNFSLSGFVFNNTVMGIYKFINEDDIIDNLTPNDGSCYSIEIKDSTNERKYLKIEKAIIDSLQIINKIK